MARSVVRVRGQKAKKPNLKQLKEDMKDIEYVDDKATKELSAQVQKNVKAYKANFKKLEKAMREDPNDKNVLHLFKMMLAITVSLIPTAHYQAEKYHNERAFYALSALVNQARELSADIRNMKDLEEQVFHIVERIINPNLAMIVQNIVQEQSLIKQEITNVAPPKVAKRLRGKIDNGIRDLSDFVGQVGASIQQRLTEEMID